MICPRCKKQIPKDTISCPHCNMKIGTICKDCGAYNLVYNKSCIECGAELVKFCPKCKSANFPNATMCRKCGTSLKKTSKSASKKKKLTPPRQFVIPEKSKTKRNDIPEFKTVKKASIINVNPDKVAAAGSPILPVKELLQNNSKMLSENVSSKKNKETINTLNSEVSKFKLD